MSAKYYHINIFRSLSQELDLLLHSSDLLVQYRPDLLHHLLFLPVLLFDLLEPLDVTVGIGNISFDPGKRLLHTLQILGFALDIFFEDGK